ncbi:MAG: inositol monophosphatase family protein [Solirubrobacteraceae bacterium]
MSDLDDERVLLAVAEEAARAGAAELVERFGRRQRDVRAKSGPTDLVSEADLAAEAAIRDVLARCRPGDAILAEEGGASGDGELRWVVDPLDGTINFLFGIPQFAVSVACEDEDGAIVGVVLDPMREELFAASRTGSATLDGTSLAGSRCDSLAIALLATGFAYDAERRARQAQVLTRVLPRVRDIRRAGAAALDLAWCACGRCDAYYERGLAHWDWAAAGLICARAGMTVVALEPGGDGEPAGLLAAPPALAAELEALVVGE